MRKSVAHIKAKAFAVRIVKFSKFLENEKREYILSKQILRSGTSIGANITEAIYGSSRRDFIAKLQIAKKEAAETRYWLELLHSGKYISDKEYKSVAEDCNEILSILVSIIKTASKNL